MAGNTKRRAKRNMAGNTKKGELRRNMAGNTKKHRRNMAGNTKEESKGGIWQVRQKRRTMKDYGR